ncbi:ACT domain-containing protein ACR4-like [Silene latifolia]|uniref:ACT domain-containing protein ACR4-like n=1 Tax=Silene latifolia TaxID=37657 RepID=UPI003D771C70
MDVYESYRKLLKKFNTPSPRVVIDNDSFEAVTVIKVEISNRHGILIHAVKLLVEMNIVITKSCISLVGTDFYINFNVTDLCRNKIRDQKVLDYIKKAIEDDYSLRASMRKFDRVASSELHYSTELTGIDKQGLCKVCRALAGLDCETVNTEICTHFSGMFAICRAVSLIKQSSCRYIFLTCSQEAAESFLFETLFERPKPRNLEPNYQNYASNRCTSSSTVMSSRIQKKIRVMRLPSVNGKRSKTSRIK